MQTPRAGLLVAGAPELLLDLALLNFGRGCETGAQRMVGEPSNLRALSSGSFITSCIVASVGICALLRAATPIIGELRKLILQRMPAGFDSGHIVDELPDLSRQRVIARPPRALQLGRELEISLPDCVLT